jgi:N-acetylneuraminic acid mutarotase
VGWKALPPIPGPGRINHAMAAMGSTIYVFGGATYDGGGGVKNLDDVYSFDTQRLKWTQHPKLPLARRAWWAVALDQTFLLPGGCTETYEREVFEYDPSSAELRYVGLLPHPLADTKFFRVNNSVIGAGGETADRIRGQWTIQADILIEQGV